MFCNLTNFGHQRTLVEAIGFYLVYLTVGIMLGAVLGAVLGLLTGGGSDVNRGLVAGATMAIVACPTLAFGVLYAKGLLRHVGYLLVAVLSVAGAVAGGLVLGLLFVAFLTTRPAVRRTEDVEVGPSFA